VTAEEIAERMRKRVTKVVTALVLRIDANLRRNPSQGGTPVDTGYARANWVPTIGAPLEGVVANDAERAGHAAAILSYDLSRGPVYVSNHVPYVQRLNSGHSQQAPAAFVERAVAEALDEVRRQAPDVELTLDA